MDKKLSKYVKMKRDKIKKLEDDIDDLQNEIKKLKQDIIKNNCDDGKHEFEYWVSFKNKIFNNKYPLIRNKPENFGLNLRLNNFIAAFSTHNWTTDILFEFVNFIITTQHYKRCEHCGAKEYIEIPKFTMEL